MMPRRLPLALALAVLLLSGRSLILAQSAALIVESPTLTAHETIPRDHTPDGRNASPALTWRGLPAGTRELAVVCADFGAGNPPPWVHWIVYGIPATAAGLPENLPLGGEEPMPEAIRGAQQGLNGWRRALYRGPAPPPGKPHVYHFTVYALDSQIAPAAGQPPFTRAELMAAMRGHVLAEGSLVAVYQRQK